MLKHFLLPLRRLSSAALGLTLALSLMGQAAEAKVYTHEGGVQFNAPDSWIANNVEGMLTLEAAKDSSVSLMVWSLASSDQKAALAEMQEQLSEILGDKIQASNKSYEPSELNGLKMLSNDGTYTVEDVELGWSAVLVFAKRPVVMLLVGSKEELQEQEENLLDLMLSLKKK